MNRIPGIDLPDGSFSPCILWAGKPTRAGYGRLSLGGIEHYAHRAVYKNFHGEIPQGLELDHLCKNKMCVNPEHLEPVSHKENVLRGSGPSAKNAQKKLCNRGHPFDFIRKSGVRECRTCKNQMARKRHAEKRKLRHV